MRQYGLFWTRPEHRQKIKKNGKQLPNRRVPPCIKRMRTPRAEARFRFDVGQHAAQQEPVDVGVLCPLFDQFWCRHLVFDHKLSDGNRLRKRRQNLTGMGRRKEIDGAAGIQQQTVAAGDAFRRWRDLPRR